MGTECEVDAICDGENYLIPGIMEQVERTGVHSGDSICVYPAQHRLRPRSTPWWTTPAALPVNSTSPVWSTSSMRSPTARCTSSRSTPFLPYRAVYLQGHRRPDGRSAVRCCLGEKLTDMGYGTGLHPQRPYVAVKVPVFSFEKLHGVDTQFGPEMKSTGEVLGIAPNFHDALLKGLIGAGYTFKTPARLPAASSP